MKNIITVFTVGMALGAASETVYPVLLRDGAMAVLCRHGGQCVLPPSQSKGDGTPI